MNVLVVNAGLSLIHIFVLLLGLFMNIAGLPTLALIFFSFSVLFQLVTLPVEIDASRRAVAYICLLYTSPRAMTWPTTLSIPSRAACAKVGALSLWARA